jgi:manganese/zinc/iron transport system permease protein
VTGDLWQLVVADLETLAIAVVTAVACAVPGAFLVLRRMALVSDAISHAILPGIVVAFFVTGSLTSPWLVMAAAATGVLTVALIEALNRTRLVAEDAAIGLVFPALFSVGVILVSRYAGDAHLDADVVLLGELAFARFDRWTLAGVDLGPKALWSMGAILIVNLALVAALAKELKLATVDPALAAVLGFAPGVLHYVLMGAVSVTAVGAFNAAGSILVVALMIAPPASAYLLVSRWGSMLWLSAGLAALGAVTGYALAVALDVSIAGAMAVAAGLIFALSFLLSPDRGLVAQARRRRAQRLDLAVRMLVVHLVHHVGTDREEDENRRSTLSDHLQWRESAVRRAVRAAEERRLVGRAGDQLRLTAAGRTLAEGAVV